MRRDSLLFALLLTLPLAACASEPAPSDLSESSDDDGAGVGSGDGGGDAAGPGSGIGSGNSNEGGGEPAIDPALLAREVDYNEALRTAAIKLTRRLPTLDQIRKVQNATDAKAAYEEELDAMLASPEFSSRMVKFWRDTMRMGGNELDTAPVLAAKLAAEGGSYSDLFTLSTGNCPTYDGATGTFTAADCANNVPAQAGVLTNPAVMRQFYGNMAFRRTRWVQEIFLCSKFPAESADVPEQIDGKDYTSPWDFGSIATAPINFQDTQSVVCANCHTTMNHIAPLFANFDADGMWTNGIAVQTPTAPEPVATELGHWLQPGETTAWRFGQQVADLPALGAVLAEDPAVADCLTARLWNFAMSKEDIIADLATVPINVIDPFVTELSSNGGDMKKTLRAMMASEDFVSF
jgi:hypothetical protein